MEKPQTILEVQRFPYGDLEVWGSASPALGAGASVCLSMLGFGSREGMPLPRYSK
jgi:hypothetical protein